MKNIIMKITKAWLVINALVIVAFCSVAWLPVVDQFIEAGALEVAFLTLEEMGMLESSGAVLWAVEEVAAETATAAGINAVAYMPAQVTAGFVAEASAEVAAPIAEVLSVSTGSVASVAESTIWTMALQAAPVVGLSLVTLGAPVVAVL